ncbi:MAG: hypothetical protein OXI24_18770 [Candidatus Poribacteria bacterium]|nr:hypothetical protein [Candidatus Poribacteria bacterium]
MNGKPRATLLSSRLDWIVFQILILFLLTVVYSVIIWRVEAPNAQTALDTFRAVVKEVVPFSQYTIICLVGIFELGGTLMLLYFHKIEQAAKQSREEGIEQGREEGIEQGREEGIEQGIEQGIERGKTEVYREIAEWNARRLAAMAAGVPFDEPPPSQNGTGE